MKFLAADGSQNSDLNRRRDDADTAPGRIGVQSRETRVDVKLKKVNDLAGPMIFAGISV
jgi:hypothetical protein